MIPIVITSRTAPIHVSTGHHNGASGYRLPVTAVIDLTVPLLDHQISSPCGVTVTDAAGRMVLTSAEIHPDGRVRVRFSKPFTGHVLIY